MSTEFEKLLGRGSALVDKSSPGLVTIAGFPVPLDANIGGIYRRRVWYENNYRVQERGTAEIRREVLARLAPGLDDPQSDTEITVRGKTYRIDFTTGDNITLRIEFAYFS